MKLLQSSIAIFVLVISAVAQTTVGHVTTSGTVNYGGTPGATLVSISVIPSTQSLPVGQSVTYTALATFSDATTTDITTQVVWSIAPPGIATNTTNLATCVAQGAATVSAQSASIIGTASLTCQTYKIVPSGTIQAFQGVPFSQQFTELGGVPPYTWTKTGTLPPGLTFSGAGLLSGTPSTLGTYPFTVTAMDTAIPPFADNASVTVIVSVPTAEDNIYCNPDGTTNFAAAFDGPAELPLFCNYTAIAATPFGGAGVLYVCPSNQTSSGVAVPGCLNAGSPGFTNYFNTVQAAQTAAACGNWIQIYATRNDLPSGPQNIYDESTVLPPTNCAGSPSGWIAMSTKSYANLPAPGSRITPAWAGQSALPGRPPFSQPAVAGTYVPMIRCVYAGPTCQTLATPAASSGATGWRIMGIEFTAPHGREPQCPLNLNGTPQCSPGYNNPQVAIGCTNYNASTCGVTGVQNIILDRILVHACDDKTDMTCLDAAREGVELQGGRKLSLIDSYLYGFKCMNGVGPCVEAHGTGGGNVKNTGDDGPVKMVNDFIEASSVEAFWGGGSSTTGVYSYDIEWRRLELWKPLHWKVDDPSFATFGGKVVDAWVGTPGSGYLPGASCTIDAPTGPNPIQALCTVTVVAGQVVDVQITNQGNGYVTNAHFTIGGGSGTAKVLPLNGNLNVKNHFELKNGRRALLEGIRASQVWKGQSDQDGFCFLLTPKNANNLCITCTVQDITIRYSMCAGSTRGAQLGTEAASQCSGGGVCLPDKLARASIHDVLFDGLNPILWISKPGAFDGFAGGCIVLQNANPQATAIQDVKMSHIGCLTTTPTGSGPIGFASTLSLGYTCKNTTAVLSGITFQNSYGGGGVKSTGFLGNGCVQCNSGSCAGGTPTSLDMNLASDNLLPVAGGFYTSGQVMAGVVTDGGVCTVAPTSCTFTGGSPSTPATCSFRLNAGRTAVISVSPATVGAGYSSAPSVSFSGQTCTTTPTATTLLGGGGSTIASTKSWCYNNNAHAVAAFIGETPMTPYPTTQGDPTNNTCDVHGGGGNIVFNTWADLKFVNLRLDPAGSEIPTGDLHLDSASPGKNMASDGTDIGPNIDILNQRMGCVISSGVLVCQ